MSDKPDGKRGATAAAPALPTWPTPVPAERGARVVVYVLLAVCGVVGAQAGALVRSGWFPGGLLLALAGIVGLLTGGAKLCRTRLGAIAPGVGWAVSLMASLASRPEGDFLYGADAGSYVYIFGSMVAIVMCATLALPAPPVPVRK